MKKRQTKHRNRPHCRFIDHWVSKRGANIAEIVSCKIETTVASTSRCSVIRRSLVNFVEPFCRSQMKWRSLTMFITCRYLISFKLIHKLINGFKRLSKYYINIIQLGFGVFRGLIFKIFYQWPIFVFRFFAMYSNHCCLYWSVLIDIIHSTLNRSFWTLPFCVTFSVRFHFRSWWPSTVDYYI